MKKRNNIIGDRGSVLVFVLSFYLMFLSWFYMILMYQYEYYLSQEYMGTISSNLDFEMMAVDHFLTHDVCGEVSYIEGIKVEYLCNSNSVEIIVYKQMPYSFFYAIIETQNE